MEKNELKELIKQGEPIVVGSDGHALLVQFSNEALRITAELNSSYHEPAEVRALFSRLTGKDVDESCFFFPPFYTDCGKNITFGKNVFLNTGCTFQDLGGVTIGDASQIGQNVTLCTLNHGLAPEQRNTIYPSPIVIGRNVWIGANATVSMKNLKALAAIFVTTSLLAGAPIAHAGRGAYAFNTNEVSQVAPAFMHYSHEVLCKLWERPELSPRDRSVVTLAALISRDQTIELPYYVDQALDNGVKPREISEIITHLAFYASRASVLSAVPIVRQVFAERKIGADQLPVAEPKLLAVDEATEAKRAQLVSQSFGSTAPGLVQYTTNVLFRDLWLRPDLAPRDRSLVTVSALIASGYVAQLPYHLNKAMDGGLTQTQAGEVITHLAFYIGWPNAFSALPVAKEVFEKRPK